MPTQPTIRFSANLGFLWTGLSLPDAIRAAARAGFDAVECHFPYQTPASEVKRALKETGLPMLGLNTARGKVGENGLAAVPGQEGRARAAIDQAIAYAAAIGAGNVHVMAGIAEAADAMATYRANLTYACAAARPHGITILIEALNPRDAPGYFLTRAEEARRIIEDISLPNLRLMADCYHMQIMGGDLTRRLSALLPIIGHIQIAGVPDRGEPDRGEVDYAHVLRHLAGLGWTAPIGAEYRPASTTDAGLGWLEKLRNPG
ncbi:MAG: isomerase [Cereibacter sphaeroides]|uniref:Isomerase n=1 Tax=Cereibacter sphaeroides TaxID=1063 RepID=A0A2W5SMV0_CERSP|nr:MAG: isomerase [Cereibacter sphaeroides]